MSMWVAVVQRGRRQSDLAAMLASLLGNHLDSKSFAVESPSRGIVGGCGCVHHVSRVLFMSFDAVDDKGFVPTKGLVVCAQKLYQVAHGFSCVFVCMVGRVQLQHNDCESKRGSIRIVTFLGIHMLIMCRAFLPHRIPGPSFHRYRWPLSLASSPLARHVAALHPPYCPTCPMAISTQSTVVSSSLAHLPTTSNCRLL